MENNLIDKYIVYIKTEKNMAVNSILAYKRVVSKFCNYLKESNILLDAIDKKVLFEYQNGLYLIGYERTTISNIISILKGFLKFLFKTNTLTIDVSRVLIYPKKIRKLPRYLTESEVLVLLKQIKQENDVLSVRNFLIFLFIYMTGCRVSELCAIKITDIDDSGEVKIVAKGNQQRVIVLNEYVKKELDSYIAFERTIIRKNKKTEYLFLNKDGNFLSQRGVRFIFKNTFQKQGFKFGYSPHDLRHSIATHLLNNGMDLRYIQEILGHNSLNTTQIYTSISKKSLSKSYAKNAKR